MRGNGCAATHLSCGNGRIAGMGNEPWPDKPVERIARIRSEIVDGWDGPESKGADPKVLAETERLVVALGAPDELFVCPDDFGTITIDFPRGGLEYRLDIDPDGTMWARVWDDGINDFHAVMDDCGTAYDYDAALTFFRDGVLPRVVRNG